VGRTGLSVAIVLSSAALAAALPRASNPAEGGGSLTFEATQAGAVFTGRFDRFRADIDFDPADPSTCRFDVRIETASADTLESQRDEVLKGPDFFWVEQHPVATYAGRGCRADGKGYALDGELTLRGVTRIVPLRFTYAPERGGGALEGSARLERLAFGVGQGEWQSTEWVGNEVTVRFDLLLPAD
jgi:polyisoprenoid-binding protein YceI